MSLLDGLLRDALLQTVQQSDVYVGIRTDNPGSTTPIGSGTFSDPYGGPADLGTWFDYTMANYASGKTVRLGPGTFRTLGADGAGNQGWAASSGMRLLGAGVAETTLHLAGTNNQSRYAIAMPSGSTGLIAFQASDFTVDAGYGTGVGAVNQSQGAISVFGAHILLRSIRITNFGGDLTAGGTMKAVNIGVVGTPSGTENIEDCVLDGLSFDTPGTLGANTTCALVNFGGTTNNPHRFSVIRNCYMRMAADTDSPPFKTGIYGILPGAGLGTIVEANDVSNLENAIYDANGSDVGQDIVIRNNYFHSVYRGVYFNRSSETIGRMILTENVIDLARTATLTDARGINLTGSTATRYTTLIIRKNIIRDVTNPVGTTLAYGINVSYAGDLNVESNVINNAATNTSVSFLNCTSAHTFNNQTSAGALLRGYNGTKYIQELEDAVQDVLIAL